MRLKASYLCTYAFFCLVTCIIAIYVCTSSHEINHVHYWLYNWADLIPWLPHDSYPSCNFIVEVMQYWRWGSRTGLHHVVVDNSAPYQMVGFKRKMHYTVGLSVWEWDNVQLCQPEDKNVQLVTSLHGKETLLILWFLLLNASKLLALAGYSSCTVP